MFCSLFIAFLDSILNLKHFPENEPHGLSIYEIIDPERLKSCFWKLFRSELVNESQRLLKSEKKFFFTHFCIILSKIELEKVICRKIWDFGTAWQDVHCGWRVFDFLSGFYFTNIHDLLDSRGKGRISL